MLVALAAAAAAAVVALVVVRGHGQRKGSTAPPPRSSVSLVGDSLDVGVEPYLEERLAGWTVHADDEVGRPTAVGLAHLRAESSSLAPYVVISLGTNDSASAVDEFEQAVQEALALVGRHRCVVWPTVHRDGDSYEPFNEVLRTLASRNRSLRVVEWERMVERSPGYLAPDGIHGSPAGYAARAQAIVAAMRSCHDDGVVP